ncbi:kinase-like domain-containing protein [Suillus lakei]|nr:kinase-like domain-containing protein [Suillus lakei]
MSRPVTEDSTSNSGIDWMRLLRVSCPRSISRFISEGPTSGNSDESNMVPDLTTSNTDSESPCNVSPSGSLSSFKVVESLVAREDFYCEGDLLSSLTQPCQKIDVDLKKYRDEPQDLTGYITRTQNYPLSYGGFSNIWKCKLDSFSRNGITMPPRDVAVKAFRVPSRNSEDMKKLIKKLRQEVFVWQELEHSHILPLYGITDNFDSIPALVCPWMENGCLHKYLETMWHEPPEMHRLFLLLVQVVLGLQYLHFRNIIHGDLMPLNVLIDENGNALLADFGLSRLLADHETSFFDSHGPGAIRWAAPEIIPLDPENPNEEVSKPNKASDIYSFGCIMMQVLSGLFPYFGMGETSVTVAKFKRILPARPTQPAIADVYWRYFEQCWSPRVETRPSVDEVVEYIKAEHDRLNVIS